jgi:arsenate reductase (thioredoxin)
MRQFLIAASAAIAISSAIAAQSPTAVKPTKVFFMCPHGAGKSVLASAYFQKLAKERGLNVRVDSGGTEPDPAVGPTVVEHLKKNGMAVPITKPRLVTPDDLATSDIVVSLGCDLKGLPAPRGKLLSWDDVPGPGQDLAGSTEAIRKHAEALVEELARAVR